MLGYAKNLEDLAKGDELKGVLKTGDIARFDEDGYFYITGRLKRFIKMFGNRVGLDEIEHHLKSVGFDALCGGEDNRLTIITINKGDIDSIKQEIVSRFGFHHSSIDVRFVESYPVTSSGKIEYSKI
jgi:acyl-coenzyme A synthetase/AMP-(fatty) acid ligase